jgi:hypothetical protein
MKVYSICVRPTDVQKKLREYSVKSLTNIHSIVRVNDHFILLTFVGTKPVDPNEE